MNHLTFKLKLQFKKNYEMPKMLINLQMLVTKLNLK